MYSVVMYTLAIFIFPF